MAFLPSMPDADMKHTLAREPAIGIPFSQLNEAVMRGDAPFSAGERELLAAYTYCLPLQRFRSSAVISITSDQQRVVVRPWPGGEKRRSGRASHHEECEAMELFLLPCVATGVSLRGVVPEGCHASGVSRGRLQ